MYVLYSQSPKVMIRYKLNKMSWKEQDSTSIWMPACARHVLGKHSEWKSPIFRALNNSCVAWEGRESFPFTVQVLGSALSFHEWRLPWVERAYMGLCLWLGEWQWREGMLHQQGCFPVQSPWLRSSVGGPLALLFQGVAVVFVNRAWKVGWQWSHL